MLLRSALSTLLACLVATSLALSCDDGGEPDALLLEISSDPPASGAPLDAVRILFTDGEAQLPVDPSDGDFNFTPQDEVWSDPVVAPFVVRVEYGGQTFGEEDVIVHVTGWADGHAVTAFERTVRLDEARVLTAHLRAAAEGCDADGDGFLDCAMAGCCAAGADELSDCEPEAKDAHPFFTGTEKCDGLDNQCDGVTDEGFEVGEACDSKSDFDDCVTGTWTCTQTGAVACVETDSFTEICDDGMDNDCDGDTDGDDTDC